MKSKSIPKWLFEEIKSEIISDKEFSELAIVMKEFFDSEEEWIQWGTIERTKIKNERERRQIIENKWIN